MSCTARLPVYVIFSIAFFPNHAGVVIFGLYLFGIAVAAIVAAVLARTLFAGETPGILILELPPYRPPQILQTIYTSLIDRTAIVLWRAVVSSPPGRTSRCCEASISMSPAESASPSSARTAQASRRWPWW